VRRENWPDVREEGDAMCQLLNGQPNGQLVKFWLNIQIWSKTGQRRGFKCKYSSFWISQQIWTTGLKMGYLEN